MVMDWNLFANAVSMCAGISGMILGFSGLYSSRSSTVKDFYTEDATERVTKARWKVYQIGEKNCKEHASDEEKAIVCSHYEYFAKLHKKRYIPFWAFSDSDEIAVITCYQKLEPYILSRREKNQYYAKNFEWLYKKIKRKNKLLHKK